MNKDKILICNCEATMKVDGAAIGKALGMDELPVSSHLCRGGIEVFEASLGVEQICVGCTQETALFSEIAEEKGAPTPFFFNIREKAGWSAEGGKATAKMAALIADAMASQKPARSKTVLSDGHCVVAGAGQAALDVAVMLNKSLSVSLFLSDGQDVILPTSLDFPIYKGRIRQASGSFGAFEITVSDYAALLPSSKAELEFTASRESAKINCSVIFDMRNGSPLFTHHESRDGYLRPDANSPSAVMQAVLKASDMIGEFEKPIYVGYDADICTHSRSQKVGCSKCIDNCPAGAITPDGDNVSIDLDICGGCGNCAAHCPTGAVSYQYPERSGLISEIQTLARFFTLAKGTDACLLLHNVSQGTELINVMARFGKGLPAAVVPLALQSTSGVGHETMMAALAAGFSRVIILADPHRRDDFGVVEKEVELAQSIITALGFEDAHIELLYENDPDLIEEKLWGLGRLKPITQKEFMAIGTKREMARTVIGALAEASKTGVEIIALPDSAPYGKVNLNLEACTLCLACVSACPADALRDNPDKPELRFIEAACVQCGICHATCPENAISLEAQLNLLPAAIQPITLKEEEPFECIGCGKPFAARSTIERISKQLAGSHRMFDTPDSAKLLQMCDTCRLETLAASSSDPFAIAQRPAPRTTDDYIKASSEGLSVDDYLKKDD